MRHAFSLVELSIVLVILGLLTGGILAGQSLIRAAEVRAVSTEYARYVAATQSFRDKYMALPGDMLNAQSFWGVAHATPATCVTTASTSALTCNGDGDGQVDEVTTGSNEQFRFWQHLANAGLIEGSYNGVAGSNGTVDHNIGVNCPTSRITSSMWGAGYYTSNAGSAVRYNMVYNNMLDFGGDPGSNNRPVAGVLKPEEAWNVDTKLDDGKPAYGNVIAVGFATCTTSANNTDFAGIYALTTTSNACALLFRNAF